MARLYIALLIIILGAGCSGPGWEEALKETAPAAKTVYPRAEPQTGADERAAQQRARETVQPAEPATRQPADVQEGGTSVETAQQADVEVLLGGWPDCYSGVVYVSVDGNHVGTADQEGRVSFSTEPGTHMIIVRDNRGLWQLQADLRTGGVNRLRIECTSRVSLGDS